ncbi:glycoside hydrolase family 97 protein [Sunxiuqinia indica]|uniref:glycoside hydrolase family 97 protein n=1 Tax=Sunxiuqinia indica TaxID=2692584 RepID=UPI001358A6B3|nr:glycoside hydrolase family 97 protein [Sunxiuqinia indica]
MKRKYLYLIAIFVFIIAGSAFSQEKCVSSPDGKNTISITTHNEISYEVKRNGKVVVTKSPILMKVGEKEWGKDSRPRKVSTESIQKEVNLTVPRKLKVINEEYNKILLAYRDYMVEFRAYNDGVAYRFIGKKDEEKPIISESVVFNLPDDYETYTLLTDKLQNWFEEEYTIKNISSLPQDSFSISPVMVNAGNCKLLIAEANLVNYPGFYLQPSGKSFKGIFAYYPHTEEIRNNGNKLYAIEREEYLVKTNTKRTFPWRVVGIFENDADMLSSDLTYLLSDEEAPEYDFSWVKPGKVLWDWWNGRNIYNVDFVSGINTATYLYMIDYAAKHGLEYVLLDEGWSAKNDLMELNPDVDIASICKHAAAKKVGVMLWAKWINVDRQMDVAFDQFSKWGVKGVKIDFMDRNDARMVNFFYDVADNAARHKLLLDFHGSYICKGLRRKYPNVMTREGVVGLEYNRMKDIATVTHDLIIPYLRMWAGPMDYTPGAMLNAHDDNYFLSRTEPMSHGTRSHQVAMYVVYESPLQMVSDSPTKYDENPVSFNFIKEIPTVWDETIPLAGEIGKYIVVARRAGDTWYIGAMNGAEPRELQIDLSFLEGGEKQLRAHADGVNSFKQAKDFRIISEKIQAGQKLKIEMSKGGGYTAIIK